MDKLLGYIISALMIICIVLALVAGIVFFARVIAG